VLTATAGGVAALAGCGSVGAPDAGPAFVGTLTSDPVSFDPTAATDTTSQKVNGLVYETLLAADFEGVPRPSLATAVERRDDRTWRVSLRDGVRFHDGSDLTAEDVVATLDRYEGTPRAGDVVPWYDGATVRDDLTLDLSLSRPYAPLEAELTGIPILPAATATDDLDPGTDPVGTGPYAFDTREAGSHVRLSRFDDHWFEGSDSVPEAPPMATVTLRVVGDQSAQLAALRAGDVDLANAPAAADVDSLRDDDAYRVTEATAGGFEFFAFPLSSPPFDNRDVRRGITRLVPREGIVDAVFDGLARPAYAPVSPLAARFTSPEFQTEMRDEYAGYDPDRAADLLERGLAEAGVDPPLTVRVVTNETSTRVKWCQLLVDELDASEYLDASLETFEWATYRDVVLASDSHESGNLMALGYSGGWDPNGYLRDLFAGERATPGCCNMAHYDDEDVNELLREGLRTYDVEERRRIYRECQRRIVADAPAAFVTFGKRLDAHRTDRIEGFETYPLDGGEYEALYAPASGVYTRPRNDG
jgi:peptide/nickel transport system substrate-binding protein